MNDNRNMILAIVLSALVLIGWSLVSDRLLPTASPPTVKVENGKAKPLPQPSADPAADTPQAMRGRAVVMRETPRVTIDTPSLQGSINLKGARFDDLVLVRQRETIAKNSPPVRLLSPAGAPGAYFAGFGWTGEGVAAPDANSVWTASAPTLTPGKPVTLSWSNATGQTLRADRLGRRRLSVHRPPARHQRRHRRGRGARLRPRQPRDQVARSRRLDDARRADGLSRRQGQLRHRLGNARRGRSGGEQIDSRGGWLGFTDKYWLTALAPAGDAPLDRELPPRAQRRLPGRLCDAADDRRSGPDGHQRNPPVRRRQGKGVARPL